MYPVDNDNCTPGTLHFDGRTFSTSYLIYGKTSELLDQHVYVCTCIFIILMELYDIWLINGVCDISTVDIKGRTHRAVTH